MNACQLIFLNRHTLTSKLTSDMWFCFVVAGKEFLELIAVKCAGVLVRIFTLVTLGVCSIICPEDEGDTMSILTIISKVRLEAFMWVRSSLFYKPHKHETGKDTDCAVFLLRGNAEECFYAARLSGLMESLSLPDPIPTWGPTPP